MLVAIGDPAVPALLDAFEKDNRRTRSLAYPSVRQPVLVALEAILRVRLVDDLSNAECLCHPAADARDNLNRATARLRAYWDTYGKLPFDERLMKVLTDPKSTESASREAMWSLVWLNDDPPGGWLPELFGTPFTAKFSKPSLAEAILASAGPVPTRRPSSEEQKVHGRNFKRESDRMYLDAAGSNWATGRIAPVLAKMAGEQTDTASRLRLARPGGDSGLGRSQPIRARAGRSKRAPSTCARWLQRRTLPCSLWLDDRIDDLGHAAIDELIDTDTEFAERALWALTDPKNRLHRTALAACDSEHLRSGR